MNFQEAIDYLYTRLPAFERTGTSGYKPGLDTSLALARFFGDPHKKLPAIHIAGTNGKGSTAHTLAAILSTAGYRTGLYTSPHLVDFRERIRIDGTMIPHDKVVEFVERWRASELAKSLRPSFFELTTIMAFEYFAESDVDVAVIETGLGGRLDTTNIITPLLSIITNVSLDHTSLLGDTVAQIAAEKAGIIKPGVPVVIGEASADSPERKVFDDTAARIGAPIVYACDSDVIADATDCGSHIDYTLDDGSKLRGELTGEWQVANTATVLTAIDILNHLDKDLRVSRESISDGIARVSELTGLRGRWTVIGKRPLTVYDTGHNPGAWQLLSKRIGSHPGGKHIVIGFVADKDVAAILAMMPREATYYFTAPHTSRALTARELSAKASAHGLRGESYDHISEAVAVAQKAAAPDDLIFIGGSNYLIAEFLG